MTGNPLLQIKGVRALWSWVSAQHPSPPGGPFKQNLVAAGPGVTPLTALRQEAESLTEVELAHIAAVAIQAKKYPRAGATGSRSLVIWKQAGPDRICGEHYARGATKTRLFFLD